MHDSTYRYVAQGQTVTRLDGGIAAALDRITCTQTLGRDDVTTLTIRVQNQRNMRSPVRIVLNALNATADSIFITLEVNYAIVLFMTTTTMTRSYTTGVISTTRA